MDANVAVQLIQSLGFPIVVCGALAWYIVYRENKHTEEKEAMEESHQTALTDVKEAIANNTLVMQQLVDKINCMNQKTNTGE